MASFCDGCHCGRPGPGVIAKPRVWGPPKLSLKSLIWSLALTNTTTTEQSLCAEYEAWCADNKLPQMPAGELSEELHYARDLTDDPRKIDKITQQLQWLATFIKRWEEATREPRA
jgi:hypothetical protein